MQSYFIYIILLHFLLFISAFRSFGLLPKCYRRSGHSCGCWSVGRASTTCLFFLFHLRFLSSLHRLMLVVHILLFLSYTLALLNNCLLRNVWFIFDSSLCNSRPLSNFLLHSFKFDHSYICFIDRSSSHKLLTS